MSSFLQSSSWQSFQESLGRPTFTAKGDDWSYLAIKESGTFNTRLYTPYGPVHSDLASFDRALDSLILLAKREKVTFIRVEPQATLSQKHLRNRGLRRVTYQQLQPTHTQLIDLSLGRDEILAAMSQSSRNITRNYHKKGIAIRKSYNPADITVLTSLLRNVAARNHITSHSDDYFTKQAQSLFPSKSAALYIAEHEGTPIAAALIYDTHDTRTYGHAAADDTYRKFNAGTALVGQMILDAKDANLKMFDLYGTADTDSPTHPWAGFTKFKKSFGGSPVTYSGAWDLPINTPRYLLYRTYQAARHSLR